MREETEPRILQVTQYQEETHKSKEVLIAGCSILYENQNNKSRIIIHGILVFYFTVLLCLKSR